MLTVYDGNGRSFQISHAFAQGGQGAISQLKERDDLCVKLYHQPPDAQQIQKLKLLQNHTTVLTGIAALPVSLAYADAERKKLIGVFFPLIHGRAIFELYGVRSRLEYFPDADFRFLIHTADNLANAFERLHQAGIIIGDVNEQNIRVLPDASINLIDCDSFQIADQKQTYPSNVGTPLWTPPELQGMDLTGVVRTANHDCFGLAQLIFLLLFAGRHPFAGIPRHGPPLSPEEAIRKYAFAFAPEFLGVPLRPPAGCPPLVSLPPEIQYIFLRAFQEGSAQPGARPTATEWKICLKRLLQSLTICRQHPHHVYWQGAANCPWCAIIRETGINLFPATLSNSSAVGFSENTFLTRLQNLTIHPFQIQPVPASESEPDPLPAQPAGLWSILQRRLAPTRWRYRWLGHALYHERRVYATARSAVRQGMRDQQAVIAMYHEEFQLARRTLESAFQELSQTPAIRQELEALFSQPSSLVKMSGGPKLSASTQHRLQDEITRCENRIQTAQQNCVRQLQVSQATTTQAGRQRNQAHANIQNLIQHLRRG